MYSMKLESSSHELELSQECALHEIALRALLFDQLDHPRANKAQWQETLYARSVE